MRWLQWSRIDLEGGLGGVEVHARSLARELRALGVEAAFSSDPAALSDPRWDVIHAHGSAGLPFAPRHGSHTIVHTLHGTTLGRMAACREWLWPGGYRAAASETASVLRADVVLTVNPGLHLYKLAEKAGKTCAVCSNGWDAASSEEAPLPAELEARLRALQPFWIYVGRSSDTVKGADRLLRTARLVPDLRFVAVPGDGLGGEGSSISVTGRLSSDQVATVMAMEMAEGLILPSRYEGLALVVLEALAQGVPVVATRVGGIGTLDPKVQGLLLTDSQDARAIADALRAARAFPADAHSRKERAGANRALLPSWRHVAQAALSAVERYRAGKSHA